MPRQLHLQNIKDKNISQLELYESKKIAEFQSEELHADALCLATCTRASWDFHFTESQNNSGCKGPLEVLWPSFQLTAGSAMRSDQVVQGFIQSVLEKLQWLSAYAASVGSLVQSMLGFPHKQS